MKSLLALLLVASCAGSADRVKQETTAIDACTLKAHEFIMSERTCAQAQAKVDAMQLTDKDCLAGFGTRKIVLCPKDGGLDGNDR